MNLQQSFHDLLLAENNKRVTKDANIEQAATFHDTLAKERARVDRNDHVFSLVSFVISKNSYALPIK
jgi:hypothetical protein